MAIECFGPGQPIPGLAAESACVHAHGTAHRARYADQELEPAEPGPLRLLRHALIEPTGTGQDQITLGHDPGQRATEPDHHSLETAVAHQQVRGDTNGQNRHPRRERRQETGEIFRIRRLENGLRRSANPQPGQRRQRYGPAEHAA